MASCASKNINWPAFFLGVASSVVGSLIVLGAFKALAKKQIP